MSQFFKRHVGLIIIIIIAIVFPVSLSNQAKLNMRIIVTGIAIDKTEDGYEATAQIVKTTSNTESSGIGAEIEYVSDKADTISFALANLMYKSGKVAAFSHTNFIILGNDILKEDVTVCLDIFMRDRIVKNSALILFSNGKAGDEIKKTKNMELSVGLGLQKVFSFKQEDCDGLMMTVLDFINDNQSYGKTAIAGVLELTDDISSNQNTSKDSNSSTPNTSDSGEQSSSSKNSSSESSSKQSSPDSSSSSESNSNSSSSSSSSSSESSNSSSSGSVSSSSSGNSSSESSSSNDKNSKIYFKANTPLYFFVDGKFAFKIVNNEEMLSYLLFYPKTKTCYIEVDEIENENLKNAKVSISVKNKKVKKKIRFENNIPCLDLHLTIINCEFNEIVSDGQITVVDTEIANSIKDSLKKKLSKTISNIYEKAQENNADIFNAYEEAYKFHYSKLTKYYKNEKDFLQNLKINIEIDVKNLDN